MTPKQFVAQQLQRPAHARVIPDRIYISDNRSLDIERLRKGKCPYNARDVFISEVYYENAEYFGPNRPGRHKYYPNGVFEL